MNKHTKKSLLLSVCALILCCAMLVGTTFAWFTDNASTAVNKIQAGTLDVQLLDADGKSLEGKTLTWQKAEGASENEAVLWEPGCTYKLQPVKIKNNGNLALKYKVVITGIDGNAELNEVIDWTYTVGGESFAIDKEGHLTAGAETGLITITGKMQESAGNEYQGLSIEGVSITVVATQDTVEYDSSNNIYDKNAEYPVITEVHDEANMAQTLTANEKVINVKLTQDIDLPINTLGTITSGSGQYKLGGEDTAEIVIDLNSKTLNVTTTYWSALGAKNPNATLVIKNGTMTSTGNSANTWNAYDLRFVDCNVVLENVTFAKPVALDNAGRTSTLKNVKIADADSPDDAYMLWICAGANVKIDGMTINGKSDVGNKNRAIKIADEYVTDPAMTYLSVKNATISSDKKSAVLVTTKGGAEITWGEGNDISGCTADSTNPVTVDDGADYKNLNNVKVNGVQAPVES